MINAAVYGGVPAIDVVRGIGFGYAQRLRLPHRFVEADAVFHFAQDHIRRRIQYAVKSLQMNRGQFIKQRENRQAIHHRGFKQKALALCGRQVAEFAVGVDDWSFVGGDSVGSVFKRGADVIDRGLAGGDVERSSFEEDVGLGGLQPVSDVCRLISFPAVSGQECPLHTGPLHTGQIQAVWIGDPSQAAGCDSSNAERNSVARVEFRLAVFEQLRERAVDVAEAEQAEVEGVNRVASPSPSPWCARALLYISRVPRRAGRRDICRRRDISWPSCQCGRWRRLR